jgi:hypothetical protein
VGGVLLVKILAVAALATALARTIVAAADGAGLDIGTMIASYGIAAPFAALCWWQMQRSQRKLDAAEATIAELNANRLRDQQDFLARVAPMLYDSALLYRQGNERLTQGLSQTPTPITDDDELHRLSTSVQELLRRMGEGETR